jgi:hypothetical protein
MFRSWIWVALAFFLISCSSSGPIIVGGGGGESEYSLIFSYRNLYEIIQECQGISCPLTVEESTTASKILARAKAPPKPVFKNHTALGNHLYEIRANEVWFNLDLLWTDKDKTVPFDLPTAAALWVEILGEVTHIASNEIKSLQTKVASSLREHTVRLASDLEPGETFEILLWQRDNGDRLFIRDPLFQTIDVTEAFLAQPLCDQGTPNSLHVFSPTIVSALPIENDSHQTVIINFSFGSKWLCGNKTNSASLLTTINVYKNPQSIYVLDKASLIIQGAQGFKK